VHAGHERAKSEKEEYDETGGIGVCDGLNTGEKN